MPRFVVCVPAEGASSSVAPCGDVGGISHVPVVTEYPVPGDVSLSSAQEFFAYGFVAILTIWMVGLAVGSIVRLVRNGQ